MLRDYAMKICYRYQNNVEQVEEIVKEGFMKLFKNIHQFEEGRHTDTLASMKGWFKRILVNTCIDHYRKNASSIHGQMLSEDTENIADRQETGLDVLSYKEIIETIRQLSPAYRTVFNMFVIEGLTHEEIAGQFFLLGSFSGSPWLWINWIWTTRWKYPIDQRSPHGSVLL